MKTKQKSRRLYKRNGVILLCWDGRVWMPKDDPSFLASDRVTVTGYADPGHTVLCADVESTGAAVEWVPSPAFDGAKRSRSKDAAPTPKLPARKPGSEGYMVFLPPGSNGQPLGLPIVKEVPDAVALVIDAVQRYDVDADLWDSTKWGGVIDRYDLREVARVSRSGQLTWSCENA